MHAKPLEDDDEETNTFTRTSHDVGLAAWFGGSLMGAVGLNGATSAVEEPSQQIRVADAGWARWTPLNAAAILAHLAGGARLTQTNAGRIVAQQGVAASSDIKPR
ncbi:MAG: hypothetical protein M3O86_00675 [Actinomycetota bacterium]|nr:hypothetical protein [Actinomycetota bacterium]